jgi:hypothetical protein
MFYDILGFLKSFSQVSKVVLVLNQAPCHEDSEVPSINVNITTEKPDTRILDATSTMRVQLSSIPQNIKKIYENKNNKYCSH